jgi:hypothetical protein
VLPQSWSYGIQFAFSAVFIFKAFFVYRFFSFTFLRAENYVVLIIIIFFETDLIATL